MVVVQCLTLLTNEPFEDASTFGVFVFSKSKKVYHDSPEKG